MTRDFGRPLARSPRQHEIDRQRRNAQGTCDLSRAAGPGFGGSSFTSPHQRLASRRAHGASAPDAEESICAATPAGWGARSVSQGCRWSASISRPAMLSAECSGGANRGRRSDPASRSLTRAATAAGRETRFRVGRGHLCYAPDKAKPVAQAARMIRTGAWSPSPDWVERPTELSTEEAGRSSCG